MILLMTYDVSTKMNLCSRQAANIGLKTATEQSFLWERPMNNDDRREPINYLSCFYYDSSCWSSDTSRGDTEKRP